MKIASMVLVSVLFMSTVLEAGEKAQPRYFDRIITIVLENTNYKDAVRDPYLGALAKRGAFFKNFHGVFHPSYPNYLAMVGGNYFWTWFDKQKNINAPNVADLLEAKGYTWKSYAEGYPGGCFLGSTRGSYARKHVPLLSFKSIQRNPERCARVVPGEEFTHDWAAGTLPNYAFYTPDDINNGHDTNLATLSAWLKKFLEPLLADPARMARTLIFITFDESKSYFHNHIYTLALGPMVKAGHVVRTRHNHYSHLRLVEDNFGLDSLDLGDDFAEPLAEIFN